jgi:PIN like domain
VKTKFSEYYSLSEEEIKKHWENDIFSFDANVLLNLYRYTPRTRDAFFGLLEKIKDRIWVSYQAAYEFQQNRLAVINAQKVAYQEIRGTLEKKRNEIEAKLNGFKKHPYLQAEELTKQIDSAFQSISRDLDKDEKNHPDYLSEDPVFNRLTILFDGRVGDDFEQAELEKLYKEGVKRYEEKIPPGYMDQKEKKNRDKRSLYGDLVVWRQVISKAKAGPESIIFVTDDLKEDWWYKFKGKTIGARPELIKEFRDETQKRINIYQADRFLEYANRNLAQKTHQAAIDEVRKVRLADEIEIQKSGSEHAGVLPDTHNGAGDDIQKSEFETAFDERIDDLAKGDES